MKYITSFSMRVFCLIALPALSGSAIFASCASAQITSISKPRNQLELNLRAQQVSVLEFVRAGEIAFENKNYRRAARQYENALESQLLNDYERARLQVKLAQTYTLLARYTHSAASYESALDTDGLSKEDRARVLWRRDYVLTMTAPPARHK